MGRVSADESSPRAQPARSPGQTDVPSPYPTAVDPSIA